MDCCRSQKLIKKEGIRHGRYSLILLTYKHPLRKKLSQCRHHMEQIQSSEEFTFYGEAVTLPGTLHVGNSSSSTTLEHLVEGVVCLGSTGCLAYLSLDFKKLDVMSTEPGLRKVLLEFTSNCMEYHQTLQVGHCYMQLNQDDIAMTDCKVVTISQKNPLQSLCFLASGVSRCKLRETEASSLYRRLLVKDTSSETCEGVKFVPCGATYGEDTMGSFIGLVSETRNRLTSRVERVCDVLNALIAVNNTDPKLCIEGALVSFCGIVHEKTSVSYSTSKVQVKDCHGLEVTRRRYHSLQA